ncbi:MAG: agmatinase [Desulfovibrio sp.]|jgi:agmatinase|nr:agmatinase [Desulfovibrio sp.]
MSYNLPITGICSFGKYPIATNLDALESDIAVLGIPCDIAVGFLSGARLGPRRIREASTQYARGDAGFYDPERDEIYLAAPWRIVDCGDCDIITGDIEGTLASAEQRVRRIVDAGAIPVVMGGDHSISISVAGGISDLGPVHVIQFDAHLDWSRGVGSQRYTNGTPMRHISQMRHVAGMTQIGMRGFGSSTKADYAEARGWGSDIITGREARKLGAEGLLERIPSGCRYYVTIDMDALDMCQAPGTASPVPGGLDFSLLVDLLEAVSQRGKVVCFDLVEVAPQYDPTGATPRMAALLMFHFMGFILKELEEQKRL